MSLLRRRSLSDGSTAALWRSCYPLLGVLCVEVLVPRRLEERLFLISFWTGPSGCSYSLLGVYIEKSLPLDCCTFKVCLSSRFYRLRDSEIFSLWTSSAFSVFMFYLRLIAFWSRSSLSSLSYSIWRRKSARSSLLLYELCCTILSWFTWSWRYSFWTSRPS